MPEMTQGIARDTLRYQGTSRAAKNAGIKRSMPKVFGLATCGEGSKAALCNLHGIWDSGLIGRRRLSDQQYLASLEGLLQTGAKKGATGTPAEWARESHDVARSALLRPNADVGETYYANHIGIVDERLAIAGLRLAMVLNRSLAVPPPAR